MLPPGQIHPILLILPEIKSEFSAPFQRRGFIADLTFNESLEFLFFPLQTKLRTAPRTASDSPSTTYPAMWRVIRSIKRAVMLNKITRVDPSLILTLLVLLITMLHYNH